jgi:DNA helicase-2/ATP-dependent DNA helicase PcrA
MGPRDDLCVVGDDYQSIYGFTGATPAYLLEMPRRFPRTLVARLEKNYRSTPQILEVANRLVPRLGGAEKVLEAQLDSGPAVVIKSVRNEAAEPPYVIERVRELHDAGTPYEEMAVLARTNFRLDDYEEAFVDAGIPFRLANAAFLGRQTFRQLRSQLARMDRTDVSTAVRALADRVGYVEEPRADLAEQELTRQSDLARAVRLAVEFDDGVRTTADFIVDVEARFGAGEGRGVNLLTYHRAKGLEFDAVFLPRLIEGDLPFKRSRSEESVAEERRLLYVGITRARSHLFITWPRGSKLEPSSFLEELGVSGPGAAHRRTKALSGVR